MRDMTKPVGDACHDDGTLKDADELVWPESPSEIVAQQTFEEWPHVDEPAPHPEGEFDRWPWSPTSLVVLSVVESEDETTILQKCKKVSMRVFLWSKWYSLYDQKNKSTRKAKRAKKASSATDNQHEMQSDTAGSNETGDSDDNSEAESESNKEQKKNKVTVCTVRGCYI